MPIECPPGWAAVPMPAKPPNSTTLRGQSEYVRVSYEWELADNTPPLRCGCGQTCAFNFGFGTTTEGTVTFTPGGVGGGGGAGETAYSELSVTVGPDDYEYLAYKVFLRETTETGTVATSGGFSSGGFFGRLAFAFDYLFGGGFSSVLPSITYNTPHTTTSRDIQAAWKLCRRRCG